MGWEIPGHPILCVKISTDDIASSNLICENTPKMITNCNAQTMSKVCIDVTEKVFNQQKCL